MTIATFLRLVQVPAWRHAHGIKLPSIDTLFWAVMKAALVIIVAMDLFERAEPLNLNHEMRSAISIANRVKQCLEGRRTLGGITVENGETWNLLCDIHLEKPTP